MDLRLVKPDFNSLKWIVTFPNGQIEKVSSSNKHNAKVKGFYKQLRKGNNSEPINVVENKKIMTMGF